jgi:hypothetical protein
VGRYIRNAWVVELGLGLLLASAASVAQLQYRDVQLTASGDITAGYNASFGDQTLSNHGFQFGGSGTMDGFYYNPKFLSFDVRPYYDQSRANSSFDSIYDSSGVSGTVQLFSGSHFPGSIGFSDTYNNRSTFGLANGPEVTTNGNGHGYNISWSELLPGFPTLTAAYSSGTGSGSVPGTNETSSTDTRNFSLRSNYNLEGFRLTGMYQWNSLGAKTPGFLVGTPEIDSSGTNDSLSLGVTHRLPLHGSFYGDVARLHYENFFEGVSEGNTTMDTVNGGVLLVPTLKSSLGFTGSYSDNLFGSLNQAISNNGIAPPLSLGGSSQSYSVSANGSYSILTGLYAAANVTHVGQEYWGQSHDATYFAGTLYGNYQRPLFGVLNWSIGLVDNATQEGNSNVGLNTSLSATRRFNHWEVGGNFGYQQNVETMLVGYNQSSYRWSGQVGARFDRWYWSAGVGGSQSLLSSPSGSGNHGENVFSAVGNGRYTANFNYSKADGTSVLTSNGLQTVTIASVVVPSQSLVLYNARSYGFGATAKPKRAITIYAAYSKAMSTTSSVATNSFNSTGMFNGSVQYQARRLGFTAGLERFSQSISAAGTPPANVNAYYVGVNRWFSFF